MCGEACFKGGRNGLGTKVSVREGDREVSNRGKK